MVDYIKASTKVFDFKYLLEQSSLDFNQGFNESTGEFKVTKFGTYIHTAYLKGIKFVVFERNENLTLQITGSLHKFFNKGKHNFDHFNYDKIQSSITEICNLLRIKSENVILHNLEFGFNIIPPTDTLNILTGLISHRNIQFKSYSIEGAEYYQCQHNNFIIKAYDKAKQYRSLGYNIPSNILRYELKFTRMNDINSKLKSASLIENTLFLNHLKEKIILNLIGNHSIDIWSQILFYDKTINPNGFTYSQKYKLNVWQNMSLWQGYKKQERLKQKIQLQKITNEHSQNIQYNVRDILINQLSSLLK